MRTYILLLCLLSAVFAQEAVQDQQSSSLADLFQHVLDVEAAMKNQIKAEYEQKKQKHDEEKKMAAEWLNKTVTEMENSIREKYQKAQEFAEKMKAAKAEKDAAKKQEAKEFLDEVKRLFDAIKARKEAKDAEKKEQFERLKEQLKAAYQKKQEEKEAEEEAQKQAFHDALVKIHQKFVDFKTKMQEAKEAYMQEKKEKFERMKASLNELKTLVAQEYEARQQKKMERKEATDAQLAEYKEQIKAQKADLDKQTAELMEQYGAFTDQKDELQKTIKDALRAGMKAKMTEYWGDKLQSTLDKLAVQQVIKEKANMEISSQTGATPAVAEGKATILDEITGAAQWQTVTWILLALAIILAIALIAMIGYHMSQRKTYERLHGDDVEHNERTPIARPVVPLGYTQEKAVVPAPSTSVVPSGPPVHVEEAPAHQ